MDHRIKLIGLTGLGLLATACTAAAPPTSSAAPPPPMGDHGDWESDDSCLSGSTADESDLATATIEQTAQSYDELLYCTGMFFGLQDSLALIFVSSFLDAQEVDVPGGYHWNEDGTYSTGDSETDMAVHYVYGDNFEVGSAGDQVMENLFEVDNYLTGTTAELDVASQEVVISWSDTGPLVELLGHGTQPANPLRIGLDELELPWNVGRLKVAATTQVLRVYEESTVTYTFSSEPQRVRPLRAGGLVQYDLVEAQTISSSGAVLSSTSWGVTGSHSAVNGDVEFVLESEGFDLEGVFAFRDSPTPEVYWTCASR